MYLIASHPFSIARAFALSLFCVCLLACERQPAFETVTLSGATMGTMYQIKIVVPHGQRAAAEALQSAIDGRLQDFNQSLSTYIADSEIVTLNQAPAGEWLPVSERFLAVLVLSQQISELSNGAFDATVAPLVNLWGFGPDWKAQQAPSAQEIAQALALTGYQSIEIDSEQARIKKLKAVSLDFSAVAKGYGVDEIAELLWAKGYHHFMVEIGGELRLHGHNGEGKTWRIGVESPAAGGKIRPIALSEVGLATSGDYRNYFEQDGVRFSHTINPATGRPITHNLASVTVIAATAAKADALATAFSVMGGDRAMALAQAQGIAIYLIERVDDGFSTRASTAFAPYLEAGQ